MDVSVIIPTYRRTTDLNRCLDALKTQIKPASQVLVIVRDTDQETWDFLASYPKDPLLLNVLTVARTGVVEMWRMVLKELTGRALVQEVRHDDDQ